jgi:hypothetical protein
MQLLELPRTFLYKVQKFSVLFGLTYVQTCVQKASIGLADCWESLDQATIQSSVSSAVVKVCSD